MSVEEIEILNKIESTSGNPQMIPKKDKSIPCQILDKIRINNHTKNMK